MYAAAARLDPERYLALARATYAEMAMAGITLVGEFHYLHHDPAGAPYADPNEMGKTLIQAAREAGIRITLLDACYLHGGIGEAPNEVQSRFSDGDADAWARRVDGLSEGPRARIGAAVHSVRAVDPDSAAAVASWAAGRARPLHAHVSAQQVENEACLAAYGRSPTGLLADAGALGECFTAVHATHVADPDLTLLGDSGAFCCLCPTTERDLADGIGPARQLREGGAKLCTGSDSQAFIDPFEEARAIELDERLATGVRGNHTPAQLMEAATAGGYDSLGWPGGGRIAPGAPADLVNVSLDGITLAGTPPEHAVEATIFAAGPRDVRHVMVAGRWIVRNNANEGTDP
jgi:formiminoglutamate deiminase